MSPGHTRIVRGLHRRLAKARPQWLVDAQRVGAFAVANEARCGSTVLGSLLGQHPQVRFDGKSYNTGLPSGRPVARLPVDAVPLDLGRIIDSRMRMSMSTWFGFDYLPYQLDLARSSLDEHADMLRRRGFTHFIILERRNLLRRLVSGDMGRQSGVWHAKAMQMMQVDTAPAPTGPAKVTIEVARADGTSPVLDDFERVEAFYSELRNVHADDTTLALSYEDDIERDPTQAYARVIEFLGLNFIRPEIRLRRLNCRPLRETIANFDAVADLLANTRYEWMLDS